MLSSDFAPHGHCCELCVAPVVMQQARVQCASCAREVHASCLAYVLELTGQWTCSNCRDGLPNRNADPNLALQRGLARVRSAPTSYAEEPTPRIASRPKPRSKLHSVIIMGNETGLNVASPPLPASPTPPAASTAPGAAVAAAVSSVLSPQVQPPVPLTASRPLRARTSLRKLDGPGRSAQTPIAAQTYVSLSATPVQQVVVTPSASTLAASENLDATLEEDSWALALSSLADVALRSQHISSSSLASSQTFSSSRKRAKGLMLPKGELKDKSGRRVLLKLYLADLNPPGGQRIIALGSSRFKGVCLKKGRWVTQISHEGNQRYVGSYDSEEAAALAYANAAMDPFFVGEARAQEALQEGAYAFEHGAAASSVHFWVNIGEVEGVEHWVVHPSQTNLQSHHVFRSVPVDHTRERRPPSLDLSDSHP